MTPAHRFTAHRSRCCWRGAPVLLEPRPGPGSRRHRRPTSSSSSTPPTSTPSASAPPAGSRTAPPTPRVERSAETKRGRDIVRYDTKTGARSILVPASSLIPPGDSLPLAIADYTWSADAKRLLIFTNTEKVWRENTRGDYWVLDRTASTLQQVGSQAPKSSLMYAKFSPQGDRVAYVSKGDIYVERLADQSVTRLTTGADSLHVNGMSDWVYEEEFSLRDGFRWSPDGGKIAFWHFDMTGVGTFLMLNNTDSRLPLHRADPVSPRRHHQLRRHRRHRLRQRRQHHLDPARRRSPAELPPLDGMGRLEGTAPAAHEPPAEHR